MINRNFLYVLVTLGLFLVTSSCSSSDDAIIDNSVRINEIKSAALSGNWRITSFVDSGKNETSDFTGYNFTFNENGTLTASNGSNTINGTWSVTDDSNNSNDDNSNDDDIDFNISFSAPPNFQDLSDDWDVTSSSTTKIDLIDISGGNGGTDTLTFERN